ncbi:unnamed protein product [Allacma fusca]|uniref:BTB domain-containing protein n=1 Tax=Allacma fusca TaxID=39272 RepID=A0A8J2JYX7_9HEXA|nr:unnamed protein product [Allacma fusca]
MSSDGNTLIDGNGNAVEIHATNPGFLTNIWKRVRPSTREAPVKYEVRYRQKKEDNVDLNNRSSATSSGSIWSKLSAFTNHDNKLDSSTASTCTSIENTPHSSPGLVQLSGTSRGESLDMLYGDVPRTKTNRKVYSENPERIRTRGETIFSEIRRHRNLNARASIDSTGSSGQRGNTAFRNSSSSGSQQGCESKRVSFHPNNSPTLNEFENQCWNVRSRVTSRENFYNVNEVDMGALYKSGKQSDVTIQCRGQEFKVHSFVLKAQSGHFRRALFMKSDASPLVINDLTPDDVSALLQYMYTGTVDERYVDCYDRISHRFEFMLQDYDVPYSEES